MPVKILLCLTFLFYRSLALAAGGFDGFWGSVGGASITNGSTAKASYDYTNKFNGSLNPPGVHTTGTYDLTATDASIMPSAQLRFVMSGKKLVVAVLASLDQPTKLILSNTPFNFTVPANQSDRPQAFAMATELQPTTDIGIGIEAGVSLSNSFLLFGMFSYRQMNANLKTTSTVGGFISNPVFTEAVSSATFYGAAVGAGLRYLYSDTIFLQATFESVGFGEQDVPASTMTSTGDEITITQSQTLQPRWTDFAISVGSRF